MGVLDRLSFIDAQIKELLEKKNDPQRRNPKRKRDFEEKIVNLIHLRKEVENSFRYV